MTPSARIAAAIPVLDAVLAGEPAEKALTNWGRRNRFAGSSDRAALRDHVFDALRNRRSFAWVGGAETGRGLMLGMVRQSGNDLSTVFTGEGYAPQALKPDEAGQHLADAPRPVQLDLPDWLAPVFDADLGADAARVAQVLRVRAPVFVRANLVKASRDDALAALAEDQITAVPHEVAETALEITANPRRLRNARAFRDGLVEMQDAASQAVCAALNAEPGMRILDYCAGGGGKALALAAMGATVFAYDHDPARMRDLPGRAKRAGVSISLLDDPSAAAPYDLILCDVPCSGSGTWRRTPEAKWTLTPARLQTLTTMQDAILHAVHPLLAAGQGLAYATCSLFQVENNMRIEQFLSRHSDYAVHTQRSFSPLLGSDGFHLTHLKRV